MAAVTRDNALAQVRRTIGAYRDRVHDVHCDTDYLPPEGAQIVNEYCSFDNDQQDLVLKSLGNPSFLDAMDDKLLLEYCATCMDLDEVLGLDSWRIGRVDSIIGVADLSRSEKIKKAIEYSDVLNEILEEIGDINILVAQMAVVSGILIGLAATGYGAVAEALGFVLLAVGAAFSGTDLLAGIIGLARFFTMVDDAKSDEDLKVCGKLFGDAVAKIGVDGLFFTLSMFGLKKASARLTTKTVADNSLNARKWRGKRVEERGLEIEENENRIPELHQEAHDALKYAKYQKILKATEVATPLVDNLKNTGQLPLNYITQDEAFALGWRHGKALNNYAKGCQIGGGIFENVPPILPEKTGRIWYEADIGLDSTISRAKQPGTRLLYSNDGLLYITIDHYKTVIKIGTWK